jgi:hypothetical protein
MSIERRCARAGAMSPSTGPAPFSKVDPGVHAGISIASAAASDSESKLRVITLAGSGAIGAGAERAARRMCG